MSFQAMRAILLAIATATSLGGLRRSRSSSQADDFLLLPSRTRRRRAVAPTIRVLRKASSPARVMTPSLTLPAVEWSFGVSPSHAANWRPDRNRRGSGVFMTSIEAPISPTPAARIVAMPSHQLDVDDFELCFD